MIRELINFDNTDRKRAWLTRLGALSGSWVIELKRWRPRRSLEANAYWHAVIVEAMREFFAAQGQQFTHEECHYMLLDDMIPPREVIDLNTGSVIGKVPARSSKMDVAEFMDLIDRAIPRLAEFGIIVPEPVRDPREREAKPKRAERAS